MLSSERPLAYSSVGSMVQPAQRTRAGTGGGPERRDAAVKHDDAYQTTKPPTNRKRSFEGIFGPSAI